MCSFCSRVSVKNHPAVLAKDQGGIDALYQRLREARTVVPRQKKSSSKWGSNLGGSRSISIISPKKNSGGVLNIPLFRVALLAFVWHSWLLTMTMRLQVDRGYLIQVFHGMYHCSSGLQNQISVPKTSLCLSFDFKTLAFRGYGSQRYNVLYVYHIIYIYRFIILYIMYITVYIYIYTYYVYNYIYISCIQYLHHSHP